ncbi:hypothetical protein NCCP28_37150 [Niallia sp. NCCP-28]|nr:hypothetical protein NCCP28_37150 [Niallia sp. NCCP-28]
MYLVLISQPPISITVDMENPINPGYMVLPNKTKEAMLPVN